MVGRKRFATAFCLLLLIGFQGAGYADGSWKPGSFEIHVFKVGQGDSQLIISPTGKTLLIDVPEMSWNGSSICASVARKIRKIMGPDFNHIDYIVATHLHLDHIGYPGYGGIWGLLEKHGFTVGKLIDRDAGTWEDLNDNGKCESDSEIDWKYAGTTTGTGEKWLCYVTDPANQEKLHREIAIAGSKDQILMDDVIVTIIQSDGAGVFMEDRQTSLQSDLVPLKNHPSENDYSITLKISYGQLDYATGGDTDGEYATSPHGGGYTYNDVESVIAPKIGDIEVLHVNHHGSAHSTNKFYFDTLKPEVSVISCGYNNKHGHPDQSTLNRLLGGSEVYLTDECAIDRNYGHSRLVRGDIIITSENGIDYTVSGESYKATPTIQ